MIKGAGTVSNVLPSTSTVRHWLAPQTEQHSLALAVAPIQSSNGRPATKIRFDSCGAASKSGWSSARVSSVGSIPSGRNASRGG